MIRLRIMKPEDIPAGLYLCRANHWNQLARDWELFLQLGPEDCRVAIKEGPENQEDGEDKGGLEKNIVGTVTTLRYQDAFSWIGMVLVDPVCQRQGIGKQLLREALQLLSREETIKLDATPAGREVYLKLGFRDEYPLSRMQAYIKAENQPQKRLSERTSIRQGYHIRPIHRIRPVQKNDLPAIATFDRAIFGADRQALLEWMQTGAPHLAFLAEEKNEIQGYCLGRYGHTFTQLGPVIADNATIAQELVSAALPHCTGQSVILDIPLHDPQWSTWMTAAGFSQQRPFIRMFRGNNSFPGMPEKQFAIAGPEFG
ncbi:GNAT family N-acetyltransferase [Flavitalea flava]